MTPRHLCLLFITLCPFIFRGTNQEPLPLEAGKSVERELAGDQSHAYTLTLAADQYLHIVVEPRGIDVAIRLFGVDGKLIAEVDTPFVGEEPEKVSLVAEAAGNFRLEVRPSQKDAKPGRYTLKVIEARAATAADRSRVAAERIFAEAEKLKAQPAAADQRKAIERHLESLPLWRAASDRVGEANTLNSIGEGYYFLREMPKAIDYYDQALVVWRAAGDRKGEAITLNNFGAAYESLGELAKALDYYNQAISLHRTVNNRREEAITLGNIGAVYEQMGEMQRALDHYNQALPLHRGAGYQRGEAMTLNNLGAAFFFMGENQKALDHYLQALPLRRAIGDQRGEAITLNNIGASYKSLGEGQKALDYQNQALLIRRTVGDRRGEAITLHNIGDIYGSMGARQKALEFFNQALPLRRSIGDRSGEATTLNSIGQVYDALGERQKALEHFNQALALRRAVGDRRGEATTLTNIGSVHSALGERQKALEHFDQALALRRSVSDRGGEAYTLYQRARVSRDLGNLTEARRDIESSLSLVEDTRSEVSSQELRASYFATIRDQFDFYIGLLMRQHEQDRAAGHDRAALQASERARARSLLDLLTEAHANIRQGVTPDLAARERDLQQRINDKALLLIRYKASRGAEARAAAMAKEIDDLTTELQQARAEIRRTSPRYAALTQPQPLGLAEIQRQLDENSLLLEYSLGEEQSYLWAVTRDSISSFALPPRAEIESAAQSVYKLLRTRPVKRRPLGNTSLRPTPAPAEENEYRQAATALSQMILGPVAARLGDQRLVIVADGALQYVPFAALPAPGTERRRDRGTEGRSTPLVVAHEIVSLPSASALALLRRETAERKPAPKAIAVFADPVFAKNDSRVKPGALALANSRPAQPRAVESRIIEHTPEKAASEPGALRIARLPFTRQEAERIAAFAPRGELRQSLDFAASRAAATSDELSQYRFVHFATHGILDAERPELSALVLSLVDERGQPQDGFLRAHEIYNLNLPAEMVVLSACETGLGKQVKGEGLVGLTRGFMYAGAPRVVVSLWNVNDQATSELMAKFYQKMLRGGQRPAAALRAAQVEMWRGSPWPSPYYWAAFVLQGEWK